MKRILVPSNCDVESERALRMATALAAKSHARIYVLRVIKTHGGAYFNDDGEIIEDGAVDIQKYKGQKLIQTENLRRWVTELDENAVQLVRYGGVADTILQAIKELKIGMVIMGNRFVKEDEQRFFGTLTDYLIRESNVPMLSLKTDLTKEDVKDIVFAHEFNKENVFFDALQDMHMLSGATVHFLRINTKNNQLPEEELHRNMDRFAYDNRIEKYTKNIHESSEIESGIMDWTADHSFPLLAVKNITKSGILPLFRPKISKKFFVKTNVSTLIYND